MKLIIVFRLDSSTTRELISILATITGKTACHSQCIREVWSYAFSLNQSCWLFCSVPDSDSVSVVVSLLRLWPSEVRSVWFTSVAETRWLICDSRWEAGKPAMAGNDTSWTVSRICSFEVFAEHPSACFPDKWKDLFKDTFVLEQALQTADYSTLQSFVSTMAWTNWINLSPTKWELFCSH